MAGETATLGERSAATSVNAGTADRGLILTLRVLLGMIVFLMALGAFVRTMNAGLACPDWPLCYGKVIPDLHLGSWLEQLHRLDAGLVALAFFRVCFSVLRSRTLSNGAKRAAVAGIFFLIMQIAAGALTVLWQLRWSTVTTHLMLATLFFLSVLWVLFEVDPRVKAARVTAPSAVKWVAAAVSIAVFFQIFLGGVVASTYAGSVCVDWPLCNGQWVPTWSGAIGNQVLHRFIAYSLALAVWGFTLVLQLKREAPWMTRQLLALSRMASAIVLLQVCVGIANLVFYIPPAITVVHQTLAIVLLATWVRIFAVARSLSRSRAAIQVSEDFTAPMATLAR